MKGLSLLSRFILIFSIAFLVHCSQPNAGNLAFWQSFDSLQKALRSSAPNPIVLRALYGNFQESEESYLTKKDNGSFEIVVSGKELSNGRWNLIWNPESLTYLDYFSKTIYTPFEWKNKPLYSVQRRIESHWKGFFPSDFFHWLSEFSRTLRSEEKYSILKSSSNSLQFLCETFTCERLIQENSVSFVVHFNENTQRLFPEFYKRSGGRLEKTKLRIHISNPEFPKESLIISNNGKSLYFEFSNNDNKGTFLNPNNLEFISDIEIKSFGITVRIHKLKYGLKLFSKKNEETLLGGFSSVGSQEIEGRFLYFIPTGVIDFFIPGNLNEYLQDALTLLVYGTRGKGGSHFTANYKLVAGGQRNISESYAEIQRKRFSLFGSDTQEGENGNFLFFTTWEEAIRKDLDPRKTKN